MQIVHTARAHSNWPKPQDERQLRRNPNSSAERQSALDKHTVNYRLGRQVMQPARQHCSPTAGRAALKGPTPNFKKRLRMSPTMSLCVRKMDVYHRRAFKFCYQRKYDSLGECLQQQNKKRRF